MRPQSVLTGFLRGFALFLSVGCAMGSIGAQLGRWSVKADGLTHLAPLYLAGSVVCLILWLAADRRTRTTLLLSLVSLTASALLMRADVWAAVRAERVAPQDETIKLIQFNLYFDNIDIEGTADWLIAQDADVLVLEEVYDDAVRIVDRLASAYPHRTTCKSSDRCGVTILSKAAPIDEAETESIQPGSGQVSWAKFAGAKGEYMVAGTHFVWPDPISPQWINREAMRRNLQRWPTDSLILTGDFNSTPWSFSLKRLDWTVPVQRRTRALLSWPTRVGPFEIPPVFAIDQVYAGKAWKTVSVERGPRLGSDHFPVVVVLTR